MSKPIQDAGAIITKAQQDVNKLLSSPEHVHNLLGINQHFERIKVRLGFMGAVIEPDASKETKVDFPPITDFMGETIIRETRVTASDLNPAQAQKEAYIAKVDKLYSEIGNINPQTILNSYTRPDDILVLRGVAKRAGVEGFSDKEITTAFIEEIIIGVELKKEEAETQRLIDLDKQPTKTTLTQNMIDASPELQKWKALPGDELEVDEHGTKKLNKGPRK